MKKKINKDNLILCVILSGIILLIILVYQLNTKKYFETIKYIEKGERIDRKTFLSPSNKSTLTVLLHTVGGIDYDSFLYIVEGEYNKNTLPKDLKYIKFPNATGILIKWNNDNRCVIYADKPPLINTLKPTSYKMDIVIDRDKLESLSSEGYKIIRYNLE